jgi:hypothetical protein
MIDVHGSLLGLANSPSTHERGKVQIDYMFASPDLTNKRARFLPFAKFLGDHRALWIVSAIRYKPPSLSLFTVRRLKLQDPCTVQRYLNIILCFVSRTSSTTGI